MIIMIIVFKLIYLNDTILVTVPVLLVPLAKHQNLRTVIVTADIHQGLYNQPKILRLSATIFDLLALVRHHPLYILLRVRRELCF